VAAVCIAGAVEELTSIKAASMSHSRFHLPPLDRRRFSAIAFACAFLLAAPHLAAAPCSRTSTERDSWVVRKVDALVRSARIAYDDEDRRSRYERVIAEIAGTMKRCRLTDDREFVERYPEFVEYVRLLALAEDDDHELGFEVSDEVYFSETSQYTSIPDFLLTPRFLRTVTRAETLPRAKALLREMNAARPAGEQLLFFSYVSRHLGTPDNPDSFRRLLIVVPGDAARGVAEKWVQFGIADPRARALARNVSVVAVLPGPAATANVYFKDYFRTFRRDGSIKIKGRWELGEGDDNCVECHKSGVLPIFPVKATVSREEQPVLEAVNERFLGYDRARFGRYLDASKFGPGLGSPRPLPQADRLPVASRLELFRPTEFGRPELRNIEPAYQTTACASCHHSNKLGSLNWPMDSVLISSFVNGGQMPLGAKLRPAERAKLYRGIIDDYFATDDARPGILKAWLLGKMR